MIHDLGCHATHHRIELCSDCIARLLNFLPVDHPQCDFPCWESHPMRSDLSPGCHPMEMTCFFCRSPWMVQNPEDPERQIPMSELIDSWRMKSEVKDRDGRMVKTYEVVEVKTLAMTS